VNIIFPQSGRQSPHGHQDRNPTSAAELARDNPVRIPNESAKYRAARTALLVEEIELRRHIERVAAPRRALPPGGER
jgi:hypothetical protein